MPAVPLSNIEVRVFGNPFTLSSQRCAFVTGTIPPRTFYRINCEEPPICTSISVQLMDTAALTLCEVQAYGKGGPPAGGGRRGHRQWHRGRCSLHRVARLEGWAVCALERAARFGQGHVLTVGPTILGLGTIGKDGVRTSHCLPCADAPIGKAMAWTADGASGRLYGPPSCA